MELVGEWLVRWCWWDGVVQLVLVEREHGVELIKWSGGAGVELVLLGWGHGMALVLLG